MKLSMVKLNSIDSYYKLVITKHNMDMVLERLNNLQNFQNKHQDTFYKDTSSLKQEDAEIKSIL